MKGHDLWKKIVLPGDLVIDATVGNGHDTLFLANLVGKNGKVVGYDIQKQAIENTQERVAAFPNVELKLKSHAKFDEVEAKLIVYNLGYLPGSDKIVTTLLETTLESLESAKKALAPDGALSIMCYPGHQEGAREAPAVEKWAREQNCRLTKQSFRSPFLLLLEHFAS